MDKVLVTGTSGYLGAVMFEAFKNIAHTESLKCRLEDIEEGSLEYSLVIHCAGALRHRESEHYTANFEGTKKLIDGLKKKTKVVFISSKSIYGTKTSGSVSEEEIPLPDDSYGTTKYQAELELLKSNHDYLILRVSTLFGLGIGRLGPAYPDIAIQKLLKGEDVSLFIPDVEQEYLYIQDLARITQKLIQKKENWNKIFNVAGDKRSLHELMHLIQKLTKEKNKQSGHLVEVQASSGKNYFLNKQKLSSVLTDFQLTTYKEIIEESIQYLSV